MKFEIARLKRRGSRLAVAWLSLVWSSVALAQSTAPPVPSPNPQPVAAGSGSGRGRSANDDGRGAAPETGGDEPTTPRAEPAVDSRTEDRHAESQCTESPGCTASDNSGRTAPCWRCQHPHHPADDGVRLWWWRAHGPAERSGSPGPGPGANILFTQPMSGSAFGGGGLMAQPGVSYSGGPGPAPTSSGLSQRGERLRRHRTPRFRRKEQDIRGREMKGAFGRKFINNGLWFSSPNRNFLFHAGGHFQLDTTWFQAGNTVQFGPRGIGKLRDGTNPRLLRLRFEGAMYENFLYKFEFDVANSILQQQGITGPFGPLTSTFNTPAAMVPIPTEVWVGERNIPIIGNLRIGNTKEPFGFEQLVSTRFQNFMERSFNNDALYAGSTQGYKPGVMAFNTAFDLRMTWAAGVFKNVTNPWDFQVGGGNWAETMRVTGLLLYEDEGREVVHLGITGRNSGYDNGTDRFRVRGPKRSGLNQEWDNYADTGAFHSSGGRAGYQPRVRQCVRAVDDRCGVRLPLQPQFVAGWGKRDSPRRAWGRSSTWAATSRSCTS